MPGEKTMRQSDEEDDDDDDGGEYEGFDFSRDDKADRRRVQAQQQQCGRSDPAGKKRKHCNAQIMRAELNREGKFPKRKKPPLKI